MVTNLFYHDILKYSKVQEMADILDRQGVVDRLLATPLTRKHVAVGRAKVEGPRSNQNVWFSDDIGSFTLKKLNTITFLFVPCRQNIMKACAGS